MWRWLWLSCECDPWSWVQRTDMQMMCDAAQNGEYNTHDEKLLLYFVERPPTTLKYLLKIHYKLNIKLECGVSTLNLYAFPQNFHQSMNISHVTYRLHVCERPSSRQQPHSYSECMSGVWPRLVHSTAANDPSAGTRQQPIFTIHRSTGDIKYSNILIRLTKNYK